MPSSSDELSSSPSFLTSLVAGGVAGTSVDVALFPIDTVKTRLQAPVGFWKAGGFRGVYRGLGAAAVGSAPGAALFFSTYESMKPICLRTVESMGWKNQDAVSHMLAASLGEAAACLVRVPTDVVKAKMQTSQQKLGLSETLGMVLKEEGHGWLSRLTGGLFGGLLRGYGITLMREIPFAAIQFPLYEKFKVWWSIRQEEPVGPIQAATCGSVSGAIGAASTTPLDVLKTRLMLGADKDGKPYRGVGDVLRRTLQTEGSAALWSGIQPRVFWISVGGFVFFGAYEECKSVISPVLG